jgi:HPt (histidine-containing phosphotransfer) domain-containing protein
MCPIFFSESAILMEKLRGAVAENDADAIMRTAHSLKGAVSYFAAGPATAAARRLEDMGRHHDITQAAQILLMLEREMDCLCRSVRAFSETQP